MSRVLLKMRSFKEGPTFWRVLGVPPVVVRVHVLLRHSAEMVRVISKGCVLLHRMTGMNHSFQNQTIALHWVGRGLTQIIPISWAGSVFVRCGNNCTKVDMSHIFTQPTDSKPGHEGRAIITEVHLPQEVNVVHPRTEELTVILPTS